MAWVYHICECLSAIGLFESFGSLSIFILIFVRHGLRDAPNADSSNAMQNVCRMNKNDLMNGVRRI